MLPNVYTSRYLGQLATITQINLRWKQCWLFLRPENGCPNSCSLHSDRCLFFTAFFFFLFHRRAAALLHDIGKIEISLDILHKAAALTDEEKELMDSHTEKGAKILSLVGGVLKEAVPIVSAHHKYFFKTEKPPTEGKKEPTGKEELAKKEEPSGKDVPLGAAIIAVADAYDAMITDRPYRAGMQPWQAFEELEKEAGKQFHPGAVKAFKKCLRLSKNTEAKI